MQRPSPHQDMCKYQAHRPSHGDVCSVQHPSPHENVCIIERIDRPAETCAGCSDRLRMRRVQGAATVSRMETCASNGAATVPPRRVQCAAAVSARERMQVLVRRPSSGGVCKMQRPSPHENVCSIGHSDRPTEACAGSSSRLCMRTRAIVRVSAAPRKRVQQGRRRREGGYKQILPLNVT